MPRRKQKKIIESNTFSNVRTAGSEHAWHWSTEAATPALPILELGCGTGQYTLTLAALHPHQTIIGIDIKGSRLWEGAKMAIERNLNNAIFLRAPIVELTNYFPPASIQEIWITFPDPYPKKKQIKHRLTSPAFLERYATVLTPGGLTHLKTDDDGLFLYTLETLREQRCVIECIVEDIYQESVGDPMLRIQTTFEKRHLAAGKKIHYVRWRMVQTTPPR